MDFSTAHGTPIPVTIDGTAYQVPRFRLPHFQAWVAEQSKRAFDEAVDYFTDDEHKARFRLYYSPPQIDVAELANELRTPAGIERVLTTCLGAAGVPAETVQKLIDNEDAMALRALAGELSSVRRAVAQLEANSGDEGKQKTDPSNAPPVISGGVPSTGPASTPDSAKPTDAALKIA